MRSVVVACALALTPASLSAQSMAASPVSPVSSVDSGRAVLRVGTEVPLKLLEELTTKNKQLRVGQRFRMETADAVVINGVTVIPVGTTAVGEITSVTNKGMWGKSGHFGARVLYLTVNGRQIRLTGAFDDKGVAGGIGAVAVSAIVFLPAGFFMTGTSAKLPVGTMVKSFVDEDVPLELAASRPAPLAVEAPQPVTVPAPAAISPSNTPGL